MPVKWRPHWSGVSSQKMPEGLSTLQQFLFSCRRDELARMREHYMYERCELKLHNGNPWRRKFRVRKRDLVDGYLPSEQADFVRGLWQNRSWHAAAKFYVSPTAREVFYRPVGSLFYHKNHRPYRRLEDFFFKAVTRICRVYASMFENGVAEGVEPYVARRFERMHNCVKELDPLYLYPPAEKQQRCKSPLCPRCHCQRVSRLWRKIVSDLETYRDSDGRYNVSVVIRKQRTMSCENQPYAASIAEFNRRGDALQKQRQRWKKYGYVGDISLISPFLQRYVDKPTAWQQNPNNAKYARALNLDLQQFVIVTGKPPRRTRDDILYAVVSRPTKRQLYQALCRAMRFPVSWATATESDLYRLVQFVHKRKLLRVGGLFHGDNAVSQEPEVQETEAEVTAPVEPAVNALYDFFDTPTGKLFVRSHSDCVTLLTEYIHFRTVVPTLSLETFLSGYQALVQGDEIKRPDASIVQHCPRRKTTAESRGIPFIESGDLRDVLLLYVTMLDRAAATGQPMPVTFDKFLEKAVQFTAAGTLPKLAKPVRRRGRKSKSETDSDDESQAMSAPAAVVPTAPIPAAVPPTVVAVSPVPAPVPVTVPTAVPTPAPVGLPPVAMTMTQLPLPLDSPDVDSVATTTATDQAKPLAMGFATSDLPPQVGSTVVYRHNNGGPTYAGRVVNVYNGDGALADKLYVDIQADDGSLQTAMSAKHCRVISDEHAPKMVPDIGLTMELNGVTVPVINVPVTLTPEQLSAFNEALGYTSVVDSMKLGDSLFVMPLIELDAYGLPGHAIAVTVHNASPRPALTARLYDAMRQIVHEIRPRYTVLGEYLFVVGNSGAVKLTLNGV